MNHLTVLQFGTSERLEKMLVSSLSKYEHTIITNVDDMDDLQNKRILFAIELGDTGINIEHMKMQTISFYFANYPCHQNLIR